MGVALLARDGPVAHQRLLVAEIRSIVVFHLRRDIVGMNLWQFCHRWQFPCGGTIGHESIGEQHHGCEMLKCHFCSCIGGIETVGRRRSGDDGHRRLAVTAIEYLQ